MRYQDWDILLYPKGCDVPFREFKTACYAVQEDGGGGATGSNGMSSTTPLFTLTGGRLTCNFSDKPDAVAYLFRAWYS
jgi:hypothetical protein